MDRSTLKKIEKAAKLLGLGREASLLELREAYKTKVKECHPDISSAKDSEERMKEINEAYETLMEFFLNYKIPLNEKAIKNSKIEDKYKSYVSSFIHDWMWGDAKSFNKKMKDDYSGI